MRVTHPSARQVSDVVLDRTSHLAITFGDDVVAEFEIGALRQACPCAACRGRREQGLAASPSGPIEAVDAELHGNWGIAIRWSDGHDTGIYSWDQLRAWRDRGAGAADDDGPGPTPSDGAGR